MQERIIGIGIEEIQRRKKVDFVYSSYAAMLDMLKVNGYQVANYHNYIKYDRTVILRHDIDLELEKALKMAKLEREYGVQSTYFVLLRSKFYNLLSKDAIDCIAEIKACGHDIGLHFDEKQYDESLDIVNCIEAEIEILNHVLGEAVSSVSMHRPSEKTLHSDYVIGNGKIVNSYGKNFFVNFKYLSDSRKCWRENVMDIIANRAYSHLHILTHPFWYEEVSVDMTTQLKSFLEKAKRERYLALQDSIRDLNSILS